MKKFIFLILISINLYGQIVFNRASKLDSTLLTTQYRLDTTRAGLISLMDNFSVDDTNIIATKNYVESRVDTRIPTSAIDVDVASVYSVDTAKSNLYAEIYTTRNMIPLEPLENGDSVIAIIDSTKTRKFITIDNFPDSTKTRKFISIDNFPDSTKTRKYVAIDHIVRTDTVAIAYNNRLLEMQLGLVNYTLIKCDTMKSTLSNFLTNTERDSTKTLIIDFLSIAVDSQTIGYEIRATKYTTPTSNSLIFTNPRLIGNAQIVMNFIGSPLVIPPGTHLTCRAFLPAGIVNTGKAKVYLTLKYRVL